MSAMDNHAAATTAVDSAKGFWTIRPRSGKWECTIALNSLPVAEAYGVHVEACSIDLFADVAAWRPVGGGFELLDADRRAVARFLQSGVDVFESSDGRYRVMRTPLV